MIHIASFLRPPPPPAGVLISKEDADAVAADLERLLREQCPSLREREGYIIHTRVSAKDDDYRSEGCNTVVTCFELTVRAVWHARQTPGPLPPAKPWMQRVHCLVS